MGVHIMGAGTKGRLEGCDIARNKVSGVHVRNGGEPLLSSCT